MERLVADSITGASRNNVTISVLDGSQLEVYSRKQGAEETPLCMRVYMVFCLAMVVVVMRSVFV